MSDYSFKHRRNYKSLQFARDYIGLCLDYGWLGLVHATLHVVGLVMLAYLLLKWLL